MALRWTLLLTQHTQLQRSQPKSTKQFEAPQVPPFSQFDSDWQSEKSEGAVETSCCDITHCYGWLHYFCMLQSQCSIFWPLFIGLAPIFK